MPTHDELRALALLTFLVGLGSILTWLDAEHPERLALVLGDSLHLAADASAVSSVIGRSGVDDSERAASSRSAATAPNPHPTDPAETAAGDARSHAGRERGTTSSLVGSLDLNRASEAELVLLPGVGPVMARRIVEHRQSHGRFRRVADLARVKGIGPKTLAKLLPYLRVTAAKDST